MARSVPYHLQTFDSPNPLARFAHRSRYERSLDLLNREAKRGASVLDFGAGTGEWLRRLRERRPDLTLSGFEPFKTIDDPTLTIRSTMAEIADASIDIVCAFEVLEHLGRDDLAAFIAQTLRIRSPEGSVILSVPIIEGLALPMKLASHAVLFRNMSGYSVGEVMAGTLGRPVPRAQDLFWSHKGFSHRALKRLLGEHFEITQTLHSPFGALPWWLNSQVFWVLRRRGPH